MKVIAIKKTFQGAMLGSERHSEYAHGFSSKIFGEKMIKHKLIVAAIVAVGAVQVQAAGSDAGVYLTASLGQSYGKFNSSDFMTYNSSVLLSEKKKTTGWKAGGGYRFNSFIAIEGAYVDLGEFTQAEGPDASYNATLSRGASSTFKNSVTAFTLAAVGSIPIGSFSLFGKVGIARVETKSVWELNYPLVPVWNAGAKNSESDINLLAGGGVKYHFTNSLALRAEYEDFGKVGSKMEFDPVTGNPVGTGRMNVSLVSVGLDYKF